MTMTRKPSEAKVAHLKQRRMLWGAVTRVMRAGVRTLVSSGLMFVAAAETPLLNLDFELADRSAVVPTSALEPYLSGAGPMEDLLPHWSLRHGSTLFNRVFFNLLAPDGGGASVISRDALNPYSVVFWRGFQGEYALGVSCDENPFVLSQTGVVPTDARLLEIDFAESGNVRLEARINGITVNDGGDISAFAGQLVDLEVIMVRERISNFGQEIGLNGVAFMVPEPGTLILSIVALGLAVCRPFVIYPKRRPNQSMQ